MTCVCLNESFESQDPDRFLIEQVLRGDNFAFAGLVERHWARIFARAHQIIGNTEDAEEITQDTFTRALQNLSRFRWEASFATWLYQIASNLARNRYWYWKRRQRGHSFSLEGQIGDTDLTVADRLASNERSPDSQLRWQELCDNISQHIQALPEPHRVVMSMRIIDELSYEEISAALDIPIGTVKSRIARARETLGKDLGLDDRAQAGDFVHAVK